MTRITKTLSLLFHPLVMPTLGVFILFNSGTLLDYVPIASQRNILYIIVLTTLFLPLSTLPILNHKNIIENYNINSITERRIPLIIAAISFSLGYFVIAKIDNLSFIFRYFIFASIISIIACFFINYKWKISLHMTGIGGLTGAIIALNYIFGGNYIKIYFILALLFSGILAFSRLQLGCHKPSQVYMGYLLGLVIVLSTVLYGFTYIFKITL